MGRRGRVVCSPVVRRHLEGFTVIELLATIGIMAMLTALLLPAVQQARAAGRRTQCENNLKELDLAMLNSADATRRFPASGWYGLDPTGTNPSAMHSWVVPLLPYIERADLARLWDRDQAQAKPPNAALAEIHLDILACPEDISVTGKGDLSYVVNGGIGFNTYYGGVNDCPVDPGGQPVDLNGNGVTCPTQGAADHPPATSDREFFTCLGMFFPESWKNSVTTRHHTPNSVLDGLSQTFLISENVRAGVDPWTANTNWASPSPMRSSFFFSSQICKSLSCSAGNVDYGRANAAPQAVNSSLTQPEGSAPWPSSFHTGDGAYFAFADGHVRFIGQSIDGRVYAALCSPQGVKLDGTPLAQFAIDYWGIQ